MLRSIASPLLASRLSALALFGIAAATLAPLPAAAQGEPEFYEVPYAEGQWNIGRRLDESQLRYCVDPRDPDFALAAEIADTLAAGLLLEPQRYVIDSNFVIEDITRVYALLLEHCDMQMGFKLIPEGYDTTWSTVTRAYYETGYVYVTADPAVNSLADLAPGRTIGALIGSAAHIQLVTYLTAIPAEQRWRAFPYGTNELALESLVNGAVDVALVWGPSLWAKQTSDPAYADLRVIDSAPLPPTVLGVGALMLKENAFLRSAVDEAIAALTADGTIQAILDKYEFPATAAP